jgi:hypothetical protein
MELVSFIIYVFLRVSAPVLHIIPTNLAIHSAFECSHQEIGPTLVLNCCKSLKKLPFETFMSVWGRPEICRRHGRLSIWSPLKPTFFKFVLAYDKAGATS